ncbi:cation-translocating P-type ATPase [Fructobacillus fructosus]|uniref:Magnesium-transporting ATPase (P-type) (MgtA) n=1 Tax=Fructobacillus fructosus TaxID=1631 RepID=A0ABM9MNS2_9LACO|nr:cation-transporting P-type ATPase [Fructobacillus fructosus]MBC9118366.1 cation-transporting P-type ATPase [Fructobacillus fructosus]MBD9364587.1 cation-transporting P-type ATPase [Leuconostoc mesenteroides]CAK1229427.1 Magnesium-transporting ATPase (P-type) (MgtA) [Fructobacillus fructosus]CAK1250932.1 Magnesium-transporting ATPase (P-type) (MgtA) [Fructobacillus fructosus]
MPSQKQSSDQLAQMPIDQFYQTVASSDNGLNANQVKTQEAKYGPNVITAAKGQNKLWQFLKNFTSLMAILLWVSGFIAIFAQMLELGIAIWAVNMINGLFSFWQENQAQKASDALKKMLPTKATVIRDGQSQQIDTAAIVPGDLLVISAGDSISADARVISSDSLQVDESALTGESDLTDKKADYHHGEGKFAEHNLVYAGTVASAGSAKVMAINTGMNTEFGQIAKLTQGQQSKPSPLEIELNRLTRQLSIIAISIGVAFFLAAIFFVHYPMAQSFIFALGMVVAFIPEGLLPTVTLSLAQGVQRMAKKHALVKNLNSVETLGETTVIASDKTGTLTQNQMTINNVWLPDKVYTVSGEGYVNNGQVMDGDQPVKAGKNAGLDLLLKAVTLNNDTAVKAANKPDGQPQIVGTPTEASLVILAQKYQLNSDELNAQNPRQKTLVFDSDRKRMSTINKNEKGQLTLYTKGALDGVLAKTKSILTNGQVRDITDNDVQQIQAANESYAKQGLRALAVAYRDLSDNESQDLSKATAENTEQNLTFVGLTIMADPPRPEIYAAVKKAHQAGIRIIMVTGDGPITGKSVAVKIGLVSNQARVVTGDELTNMSDDDLREAVKGEVLFARVAPEQKYRIVKANQANGEIVASTGDGVNDAPALKQADIGIAMGATGTDVAKEAADMILTDDNFASIIAAIEEGRTVYSNIQKFLLYILNSNVPEAFPSVLFLFSGGLIPLPLTVMQILTIDLGTDMLPALGLGSEKSEPGVMQEPPRSRKAHLLNKSIIWKAFALYGLVASLISSAAYFFVNYAYGWPKHALSASGSVYAEATTITLAAIVFCQIAAAMNARTKYTSVFKIGLFSNRHIITGIIFEIFLISLIIYVPFLQGVFNTHALGVAEWLFLIAIPIPLVLLEELRKWFVRKYFMKLSQ